jgi:hypothetical protein
MSKYAKNTKNTKNTKQIKKVDKVIETEPKKTEDEENAIKLVNKMFAQLSFKPDYHFISKVITTYIFYKFYRNPDYYGKYIDGFNIQLNVISKSATSDYDKLHIDNFISYMDEKKPINQLFLNLLNYSKNDTENFSKNMQIYLSHIMYIKFNFQYISKALLYLLKLNPNPEKERQCIQYGELIDLSLNCITLELLPNLVGVGPTKEQFDAYISSIFKNFKLNPDKNSYIPDVIQKKYDKMNLEELRAQDVILNLECYKFVTYDQIAFRNEGFPSDNVFNTNFSKNIQILLYIRKRKNIIKEQQKQQMTKEQMTKEADELK